MSGTPSIALSPGQRAWQRFRRNRIGFASFCLLLALLVLSLGAELISNDRPFIAVYEGQWTFPVLHNPPERAYGGDFDTPTDWKDPFIAQQFAKPGNWRIQTLNRHSADSVNAFQREPNPAPPNRVNWLGTDEAGRDVVAGLLYGFG